MFRILAIAGLAGGLLTLTAASAEAGDCCGDLSYSGYSAYSPSYVGNPGYHSGLSYGVRPTNPYAYDPIARRAGVGYGAYYGSRRAYAYQPYYGRGGYRSPYYRRGGMIIPPSGRGGYGSTYYRSGGYGPTWGYGPGYRYSPGYGSGIGYGYGPGISIGIGR